MQTLISQTTVPPDGYRVLVPETETWIRGGDYFDLFTKVQQHRKANNLPLGPLWKGEVEDQLCRMLPPGFCKENEPGKLPVSVSTRMEWADVENFTRTMASWAFEKGKTVTESLANARANICRTCYYNVQVPGCKSCRGVMNVVATLAAGKKMVNAQSLRNCAVCKCHLPAKVWLPIDVIQKGTPAQTAEKYPAFCWVRQELAANGMGGN